MLVARKKEPSLTHVCLNSGLEVASKYCQASFCLLSLPRQMLCLPFLLPHDIPYRCVCQTDIYSSEFCRSVLFPQTSLLYLDDFGLWRDSFEQLRQATKSPTSVSLYASSSNAFSQHHPSLKSPSSQTWTKVLFTEHNGYGRKPIGGRRNQPRTKPRYPTRNPASDHTPSW